MLIVTILDVMYCNFTSAHNIENVYQDGNSPTGVDWLLVLVWAWY